MSQSKSALVEHVLQGALEVLFDGAHVHGVPGGGQGRANEENDDREGERERER